MESSQFSNSQSRYEGMEPMATQGATCNTYRVKLYGKLHFLKRLKPEYAGDIRYQEALRKEFETGYRLEHPNLVRYIWLDNDSILMEYADGETLSQQLANHPEYFRKRKNTDKFVRQLLAVVSYLHSNQVLHLDLKPDNILLTRINDDVKLIDFGCRYTDSFPDTTGHTNAVAAPEQLSGRAVDARTDIYAIGKILECLPNHSIYNKVIARCMAERPADRYQSVEEIANDLRYMRRNLSIITAMVLAAILLFAVWALYPRQQQTPAPVVQEVARDTAAPQPKDTLPQKPPVSVGISVPEQKAQKRDDQQLMEKELDRLMDKAYRATIASFCDSVFPPSTPSPRHAWADVSTEFHNQTLQISNQLTEKYPAISESIIYQEVESRFQSLVGYVFNKMRENVQNR